MWNYRDDYQVSVAIPTNRLLAVMICGCSGDDGAAMTATMATAMMLVSMLMVGGDEMVLMMMDGGDGGDG